MERPDLSGLAVGCNVIFVDPVAGRHQAVVTSIFGDPAVNVPCINIVYVNPVGQPGLWDVLHDARGYAEPH